MAENERDPTRVPRIGDHLKPSIIAVYTGIAVLAACLAFGSRAHQVRFPRTEPLKIAFVPATAKDPGQTALLARIDSLVRGPFAADPRFASAGVLDLDASGWDARSWPPPNFADICQKARDIGAYAVLSMRIVDSRQGGRGPNVSGAITVEVSLRDVSSWAVMANGTGTGWYQTASHPAGLAQMKQDAVDRAASAAIFDLRTRFVPVARVISTVDTDAVITLGANQGYRTGMQVFVACGFDTICEAKVVGVSPESARIHALRTTRSIHPGDRVVPIVPAQQDAAQGGRAPSIRAPTRICVLRQPRTSLFRSRQRMPFQSSL